MRIVIDRFEGEFTVVETCCGKIYNIPSALLENAKEGDVVDIEINHTETSKRKELSKKKLNKLWTD